jgi:hypothetical protein
VLWMALELLKLKASNRWSDSSFSTLYGTYLAKKIICPLTLGVAKIHACLNHYILYQKEHEFKDKCPRCNDSRYKRNDNNEKDLKDQRRQPEGGVNGSQLKFLAGSWPISRNQPDAPLF